MTITMLYGFVPGALWGFVVMPWYGWTALGMSGGFPLLAATCVVWFFAGVTVVAYGRAARNLSR
ncbi:MAG: hypothetical protein WAU39_16090 [Polyangiales bacterium]